MDALQNELDDKLRTLLDAVAETHGQLSAKHAVTCFAYLGICTLADLAHYSRYDFLRVPRCGRRTTALIEEVARLSGLPLREGYELAVPLRPPPTEANLFSQAIARFAEAYHAGREITLSRTEVAALGSLLIVATKRSQLAG